MMKTTHRAAGGATLIALATAGLGVLGPAGAVAASGGVTVREGTTTVKPGGAAYRTLQRAKVTLSTLGDAKRTKAGTRIPVTGGSAAKASELRHSNVDGLLLRRGSSAVRVTGLRIRLDGGKSRVTGRIDGKRAQTLFTIGSTRLKIDSSGGSARTATRSWTLTAAAARTLGRELRVERLRKGTFARASSEVRLAIPGTTGAAPGAATPAPGTGGGAVAPTPPPSAVACQALPGDGATQTRVLDWGLRQSFRNYVGSEGRIVFSDGAARSASGTFLFGVSSVTSYDASGALSAAFRGSVYFEKWGTGDAAALRLWLCNPRIDAPAGATVGALHVDMLSKRLDTGTIVEYPNVRLADIDLTAGTRQMSGGAIRWSGVPTKLTAQGVEAFAGFYTAGEALDPLSLTVAVP